VETREHETSIRLVQRFRLNDNPKSNLAINSLDIPCSPSESPEKCTRNRCLALISLNKHLDKVHESYELDEQSYARSAVSRCEGPIHLDFTEVVTMK